MPEFEQHFCGVTRYHGPIVTSLWRIGNCGVTIDQGALRVVDDSRDREIIGRPLAQVGYSVSKVQGKVGSVTIHVDGRKFLIDFGMVKRAETGSGGGGVGLGREIGARFLDALRASDAAAV